VTNELRPHGLNAINSVTPHRQNQTHISHVPQRPERKSFKTVRAVLLSTSTVNSDGKDDLIHSGIYNNTNMQIVTLLSIL